MGFVVILALLALVVWRVMVPQFFPAIDPAATGGEAAGAQLPSLQAATAWLNGGPLPPDSLRGHPTVIALWSDTDPACLRALPAIESWHEAYERYGVRVIGVHEPDFAFAADSAVPAAVVRRLGLRFPIALDAASAIRTVLGAPMDGPRIVLADPSGTIVESAVGRQALPVIERRLREQVQRLHPGSDFPGATGIEPVADSSVTGAAVGPLADVVLLGTGRARAGPLATAEPGRAQHFTVQFRFQVEGKPNVPYPVGLWTPSAEGPRAERGGAENYIALRYDAGALWAVMSPPAQGPARVWILRDEHWLAADALGADAHLDGRGASYVDVTEPRLYAVCAAKGGEHVVKLSPETPGVTVHALIVEPAEAGGITRP